VVGDDNISPGGTSFCAFGEAFGAERAAGHAEAFPRGHADLGPRPIGNARLEVVAVTGLRRRCPGGEPLHVATQRGGRLRLEQFVLRLVVRTARRAVMNLVEAQIILATLQQRETRLAGQRIGERVDQLGQIAVDQLALQGDRRGGHHHRRLVGHRADDRRNQIGQ
jgi:hypothetical protein